MLITSDAVTVRVRRHEHRVALDSIAEAVRVENLHGLGEPVGYVALLDGSGRSLWQGTTRRWSEADVTALTELAPVRTELDVLTVREIDLGWPHLLAQRYRRQARFATFALVFSTIATALTALAVVISLVLL